jgi:hypothetical protein
MARKIIFLVTRDGLGSVNSPDSKFGMDMFDRLLHTLEGAELRPQALCFYTNGVKLLCEGSSAVMSLQLLSVMGVRMLACRSCLEYFGLSGRIAVGEVVGMSDIFGLMTQADSVITI